VEVETAKVVGVAAMVLSSVSVVRVMFTLWIEGEREGEVRREAASDAPVFMRSEHSGEFNCNGTWTGGRTELGF
jgi:hypothetical protein